MRAKNAALLLTFAVLLVVASPFRSSVATFGVGHRETTTTRSAAIRSSPATTSTSLAALTPAHKTSILLEKIVRPPSNLPTAELFLPSLVAYLQDEYVLPDKLPIVYEKRTKQQQQCSDNDNDNTGVLTLESPLSAAPTLQVQIVVLPEQSMAMVAVSTTTCSKTTTTTPIMVANLVQASHEQIVSSLERGLEDYGRKGGGKYTTEQTYYSQQNNKDKKNDFWIQEMLNDGDNDELESLVSGSTTSATEESNVIDAQVLVDSSNDHQTRSTEAVVKNKQALSPCHNDSDESSQVQKEEDFAVAAARRKANNSSGGQFAVEAAKRVRQTPKRTRKPKTTATTVVETSDNHKGNNHKGNNNKQPLNAASLNYSKIRPPLLDAMGKRKISRVISRPNDRRRPRAKVASRSTTLQPSKSPPPTKPQSVTATVETPQSENHHKRRVHLNVRQTGVDGVMKTTDEVDDCDDVTAPDQKEAIRATQEALAEMVETGESFSPQDLLQKVMDFDENAVEKEEEGFAKAAFAKAKEILEQKQPGRTPADGKHAATSSERKQTKMTTSDDDLRQMFAAGERLAESRLSVQPSGKSPVTTTTTTDSLTKEEDEEIDSLIASEKSISSYARVLDEELSELEVRINKSPGQELDGPADNPIFDVLSGPETYNPNVDPETAVNWPGAKRGKKNLRLPPQLDAALSQSNYAAEVLRELKVDGKEDSSSCNYSFRGRALTKDQVDQLRAMVGEAVEIGLIDDPVHREEEKGRLQLLLDELWDQPEERYREIALNFKDLLLSDNFSSLIEERLQVMVKRDLEALQNDDDSFASLHEKERKLMGFLIASAQLLLKEVAAVGAELEARQLEVVRSICKVAMDPRHRTEEERTIALTDAVKDMSPLLDEAFVAYLKYAVAEEESRLARAGVLDDPDHCQWLFVLKVVQQGVYSEISRGVSRYIDHIFYILRMETAVERRMLLEKIVDAMPTLDVRPFVQVVDNIAGSLGDSAHGEFDEYTELGDMTNKILQLYRDVKEILPPDRIALLSRDADKWAEHRKQMLLGQRKTAKARLKASRETEHMDDEVDALGRKGEVERFD